MKPLVMLSVLLFGFTFIACGQKNAPEAVKKVFAQKYADAKSVKWANESANEWEAEFALNGKEMSVAYDNNGKWLETETEVDTKDLPASVSATLNKDFAKYKTGEISVVENPEMKGFEIGLKKGETALEVVIDANGKVLKNTPVIKKAEKKEKE